MKYRTRSCKKKKKLYISRTLRCIVGNTLRNRIRNEDVRNMSARSEMSKNGPESGDEKHGEIMKTGWRIIGLQKSQKMENQTSPTSLVATSTSENVVRELDIDIAHIEMDRT